MDLLKKKRKAVRSQATRLTKETEDILTAEEAPTIEKVSVLLERLQLAKQQLSDVDAAIEPSIKEDEAEAEFEQIIEYSDKIAICICRLKLRKEQIEQASRTQETRNLAAVSTPTAAQRIKLPKLELTKFDGKRKNWQPFWEQFEVAVHNNTELSNIDRLNYLKTLLIGEAETAIAGLQASGDCYVDAVDILRQRFGNPEALIQDHMQGLIDVKPVFSAKNVRGLRRLYDDIQVHMRGLKALDIREDGYQAMLYPVLLRALPKDLILEYHRSHAEARHATTPTVSGDSGSTSSSSDTAQITPLRSLLGFLRFELESRERTLEDRPDEEHGKPASPFDGLRARKPREQARLSSASALHGAASCMECVFCHSKEHGSQECQSKTVKEKKVVLATKGGCFRCTRQGHLAKNCRVKVACKKCKRRHATSMCDPSFINASRGEETTEGVKQVSLHASKAGKKGWKQTVLMPTVTAWNKGTEAKRMSRILFDSGSQRTFISEECSRRLGCRMLGTEILSIGVLGGHHKERTFRRVELCLFGKDDSKTEYKVEALEISTICDQTIPCPDERTRETLLELSLTPGDESQHPATAAVDVLIGSDYFWRFLTGKVRRLDSTLTALESVFVWAVQGQTSFPCQEATCAHAVVLRATVADQRVEPVLRLFWELEGIGVSEVSTNTSDTSLWEDFTKTVKVVDRRYEVKLPWRDQVDLSDNRGVAEKRFRLLGKRLSRAPALLNEYDAEMRRLVAEGICEVVPEETCNDGQHHYYMPHQPVLRESSSTTKLRIVFDASSHGAGAKSLNENLECGPNLNPDLVRLLLNFRRHRIALVADVEKAFLQVRVAPEDRDSLRFLWNDRSPELGKPLPKTAVLRMTRVPFGVTSSPFLLAATLRHHLEKVRHKYPETAELLKRSIYLDDLLCGAANEEEAAKIFEQANDIFEAASMRLHKWGSNSATMRSVFSEGCPNERPLGQPADLLKVLGLTWQANEDVLTFSLDPIIEFSKERIDTKRFVLQTTARLYDPLGILTPFTMRAKALFQEIWKENLSWDQPLPGHILEKWVKWCEDLSSLNDLKIPRTYEANIEGSPERRTLHIFADASTKAYGTVAYLCTESSTGQCTSTLVMSKCRVAPVKPVTLARLELMAALLASRLLQFLKSSLEVELEKVYLWTDSMITLSWIRGEAARWKEFVRNRVAEIQQNTDSETWRHCPGKVNPADLMTRGMTADGLIGSELWWNGPPWITRTADAWPNQSLPGNFTPGELEERKEVKTLNAVCREQSEILDLNRFSSVAKVNRVTGWILRFVRNLRSREKQSGPLTAPELQHAESYWLKQAQKPAFSAELHCVAKGDKLPRDSPLKDFVLWSDEIGLLRIRGRLCSEGNSYDERHPIVLPKQHRYTALLVHQAHKQLLHAGARDTHVQLREMYWIVRGRQLVKSVVRSCVVCRRLSASRVEVDTGLLPPERTSRAEPFEVVGVDFAGPLLVKEGSSVAKSYIVIFTCAVTRAIHLELVRNMTTDTFIQAFRRFVSRLGLCRVIYSDNALTFKRASKELRMLWNVLRHPDTQGHFANSCIEWRFIVERAPWWGGFYKRLVRSVKTALKKIIGRQCLGFVDLTTVLAEVEAVINSRPLTYVYDNPNDGAPLTPANFLSGRRLTALPIPDKRMLGSTASSLRTLWAKRKHILHLFWQAWQKEYLRELRSAYASKEKRGTALKAGDVVLVRENLPRLLWKTGVIARVSHGRDGKIRSCEVRLPRGKMIRRPVQLLYPIELNET